MDIEDENIEWIKVEDIHILNPRNRDKTKFAELTVSIEKIGLKKPITLAKIQKSGKSKKPYNLVCGQGRLEACLSLGHTHIPARVLEIDHKQTLICSLIENIARRTPNVDEEIHSIIDLRNKGDSIADIARKIGLSRAQTQRYVSLFDKGETRLLDAVLKKKISASMASLIVSSGDEEMQSALFEAYEEKKIKKSDLTFIKDLVEKRNIQGKRLRGREPSKVDASYLVATYKKDAEQKEEFIRKANAAETQTMFIYSSLSRLIEETHFMKIIESEKLSELPEPLAEKIQNT